MDKATPQPATQLHDLEKVLDVTRAMAATVDLDELLGLIVERSMELLDAERATLFLYDALAGQLVSRVAAGADEIRIPADRGIAGAAATSLAVVNVPDAYADERFNPAVDRQTGFRTRNILSVPLCDIHGQLVGVLQVLNKRGGPFGDYDIRLAQALAAQAGVGIHRGQLIEHYIEKQQMERAMTIARDIQRGLLPAETVRACGFDVAGFTEPADQTGGDIYDFMPLPDGRWMILVADASGHGIGPALVIAETRAMLRALCCRQVDIATVMATTNDLLMGDLQGSRFVTCFFGLLDPLAGLLNFASAGHGPMLFYRRAADAFDEQIATALPLGIMEAAGFDEVMARPLESGDFAMIMTDGFFEATNAHGEAFGIERVTDRLRRDRDLPAAEMIANLHRQVCEFTGCRQQDDDLTAVIIRRK